MELDVPRNLIRFDESFDSEGEIIPVTSVMGIPVIGVKIEGKDRQVFFDTGAQLSYADPDLMNGKDANGEMEDFYPGSEILKPQSMSWMLSSQENPAIVPSAFSPIS